MSEVKFKLAAGTNVGLIRTNNEDNFIVCPDLSTSSWLIPQDGKYSDLDDLGALLVVADGMGGANAGEVASAITVQTIQDMFVPEALKGIVDDGKAIQKFMADVVKTADLNIVNHSHVDSSTRGMGTTVVMAWILGRRVYVCWCGDSRCYVLNATKGLIQLSKDHSFVQELVDKGELDAEYMHDHPLSNVVTRCLGDVDKRAQPDTRVYELQHNDVIMLCSDGLCGLCHDGQIAEVMENFGDEPVECKNELISAALSNGGHDNVTIAVCTISFNGEDETTIRPVAKRTHVKNEQLRKTVNPYASIKEETEPITTTTDASDEEKPVEVTDKDANEEPAVKEESVTEPTETMETEDKTAEETETEEKKEEPNQTKQTTDEGKDKKKTKEAPVAEAASEDDELSDTQKAPVKKEQSRITRILLWLILLLLVIAVSYIALAKECEPLRQEIFTTFGNLVEKLKNMKNN